MFKNMVCLSVSSFGFNQDQVWETLVIEYRIFLSNFTALNRKIKDIKFLLKSALKMTTVSLFSSVHLSIDSVKFNKVHQL